MTGIFDWNILPWYNKDHPKSKFKVGEKVRYHGEFEKLHGIWEVAGVNLALTTTFEYALRGFPYLVWEDEIGVVSQVEEEPIIRNDYEITTICFDDMDEVELTPDLVDREGT